MADNDRKTSAALADDDRGSHIEPIEDDPVKPHGSNGDTDAQGSDLYAEALARYPNDESIDQAEERKLVRKIDIRILPLLGMCYFFYYVDKTTL